MRACRLLHLTQLPQLPQLPQLLRRPLGLAALGLLAAGAATAQPAALPVAPGTLTAQSFEPVLAPVARREGRLVFYNFAGNFDPVWRKGLIPQFESRYGVKVEYHNVRLDQANHQLVAVHKAGKASPVDVYFAGGPDNLHALQVAVAPWPLSRLLPELATVPEPYKDTVFGIQTGGRWPIVHRSQLVLGYDSAFVKPQDMPRSFEALLAWAERNPKKFALTSPAKGGSGSGFIYSAALHLVQDAACRSALTEVTPDARKLEDWAMKTPCLDPLWRYLGRLAKAAEITNGNADTLNLLNNQRAWIGTTWEDLAVTFVKGRQLPASFRVGLLQPGLVAGGDGLIIAANSRSPAAALLFVNMAFGAEFQRWKFEQHASRSPRADVERMALPAPAALHRVPAEQLGWSVSANWAMSRALSRAFDEKILSRL